MSELVKPRISTQTSTSVYSQKTFGEVFGYLANNTFSREQLSSRISSYRNVHYGDILVKYGETLDVANDELPFISANAIDKAKLFPLLNNGDVIIADTAEDETVGKCTEVVNVGAAKIIAGLHTMACRPREKFASGFLGFYMNSPKYHDQLLPLMQGTKVTGVSKTAILDTKLLYPSFEEQKDIVLFLTSLNRTISENESEITKLQDIKKAYRSMLFPRLGEKRPRLRFKGFKEDWDTAPLSDYLTIRTDICGNDYTIDDVLSVSGDYGVVNQIAFQGRSFAGASIANYRVVNIGNVIYTKSPLKANPYGIIKAAKKEEGVVSPLYAVYNTTEKGNANFIQVFFDEEVSLNNYLRPLVNKGAKNTLLISDATAISGMVTFPKVEEQRAIADFFVALDTLIQTNKRRIEQLKHIKAACLDGMFVNE